MSLNGLLLTAEVVDSENWIVRLTWSNVGTPPIIIPVHKQLYDDANYKDAILFCPYYNMNKVRLSRGEYSENYIFDYLDRTGEGAYAYLKHREANLNVSGEAYYDNLDRENFHMSLRILYQVFLDKKGDTFSCLFKFPRDTMDKDLGIKKGDKVPVDFTYKVEPSIKGCNMVTLGSNGIISRPDLLWTGEVNSNLIYLVW